MKDKYEKLGDYHWKDYGRGHPKLYGNVIEVLYRSHVNYITRDFSKRKKGTILDVGCGDGLITCILRWDGWNIEGIDISEKAIEIATKKCPTVEFKVKDIFDEKRQFDYLLASEIIEHLPNPIEFLQKIKKLFKRESLITTPNRIYHEKPDPYHFKEYNEKEFLLLLKKHFSKVQIEANGTHLYAWVI